MIRLITALGLILGLIALVGCSVAQPDLAPGFQNPPPSARPWVYWFWLNGNLTKEGITADLEAMKRVGIGGVLIMEVDQGAPPGPARFGSDPWRELFKHVCAEAARLGLEVNMNNDAGWCGSGGPWITPDLAMQKVVWAETAVPGSKHFEGVLPQPPATANYYRDIAVLAFPNPSGNARIENIQAKAAFVPQHNLPAPAAWPALPADQCVTRERILALSKQMDAQGRLTWDPPEGSWTVVRFGYTPTGATNAPAPTDARGLECDKFSKEGAEAAFNGLMSKLIATSARWRARRSSRRTSTVGRSVRKTGLRSSARSSSGGAATTRCRTCPSSPAAWWGVWSSRSDSCGTGGRRSPI